MGYTYRFERSRLPVPAVEGKPEWVALYYKAWELAFQNVDDIRRIAEEMKEKLMNMELDKSDLESLNQLHMVLFRTSKFIMKKTAELVETLTDEELGV